jgi:hypothetical protein
LALVLGALLLTYAYPVRIYLNQQAQIAALQGQQTAQQQRILVLADQVAAWNDPAYVAAQARQRLQMVEPGDTVYLVTGTGLTPAAGGDPATATAQRTGPWYSQLWSSLHAADRSRP